MTTVVDLAPERVRRAQQDRLASGHLTDLWLAELFAETHADRLRHHHRRACWLRYDPPVWRRDGDGAIYRHARDFVRTLQQEAAALPDRGRRTDLLKFALKAEGKNEIERFLGLARNLKPLADAGEGWDADPWLFAVPNGVIDLRTGQLRSGDASDRLTLMAAVPFDPEARAPRFARFLDEIFNGDAELIAFVQRFVGYTITGCTHEQVLGLFYGTGANGKSTFINVLRAVLGDYAHNLPFSALELKQRSAIPNDIAGLEAKRFVTASETNDGTRLNEARIKMLTGKDPVSARFMYADLFTFHPVAKFILAVNHKPTVQDDSVGFWRRIRLVPFLRSFQGDAREDGLEDRLIAEGPGILRWAVAGCGAWRAEGLGSPTAVRTATAEYQADSDPLAEFIEECCEPDADARTRASDVHEAYAKWCDRRRLGKHERLSSKDVGRRMAERFARRKTMGGWVYDGVKVLTNRLFG
jgi:putative DNA primase/helicase